MQVDKISNQNNTSFGIRYANKAAWDKDLLKTFNNSTLRKSIDNKYPSASISLGKFFDYESDTFTLVAGLKLAENKLFRWTLSSHSEDVPKRYFADFINTATLEDVETKAVSEIKPMSTITITPVKPTFAEKVKKFFGKLFL